MSNFIRFTMVGSALICALAPDAQATPQNVMESDNMVSLPMEMPLESPQIQRAEEENMVVVPDESERDSVFVPITGPNYVEAGVNYHHVSNNQGNWFGQFITGQIQTDKKNRWNAQLQHQKAFHDEGYFFGVGNMHTFDDTWFSEVGMGVGTEASFLPRFRTDASLSRRWLEGGNLVTTGGVSFSKASDIYTSYGLLFGISYYFDAPWVFQAGVRSELSNPGQVVGTSGFASLTYGYQKHYYITGRVGYAHEAYQLLGGGNITSQFNSHSAGLNWRQWLGEDWGFNLGGEYYKNPFYHRNGGILSVFKEF